MTTSPRPASPGLASPCLEAQALAKVLELLARAIEPLTPQDYASPASPLLDGAIGGHVRHCLDHAAALLAGLDAHCIDYDNRQRGTAVESSPSEAVEVIATLRTRLHTASIDPSQPVTVRAMVTPDSPAAEMPSTLGRELVFVLSHTIHHSALLAGMLRALDSPLPKGFGYAPSTLAFLHQD